MRLIKLIVSGFRRFEEECSLDLNEDIVALVGPNEVGKSSLLEAMAYLLRKQRIPAKEVTAGGSELAIVKGYFVLDQDDQEAIVHVPRAREVTHVEMSVASNRDAPQVVAHPHPTRDLRPRFRCAELLDALRDDAALAAKDDNGQSFCDSELFRGVHAQLISDIEPFPTDQLELLAKQIRSVPDPLAEPTAADKRAETAKALIELAKLERSPHPFGVINGILVGRTPKLAWFQERDRTLRSEYNLTAVSAESEAALNNLFKVAKLDLQDIQRAVSLAKQPYVERVFEQANARLKTWFSGLWLQSKVYPRFSTPHENVLRVMIAVDGDNGYSFPEERSDGLRWFIALQAFIAASGTEKPVLVVDEAETHLHYDAQADLVNELMDNPLVSKVVYTTHSVGCLPPDLGSGIRAIVALPNGRSSVANGYWSAEAGGDRVGYSPLLFAMGARMLAFTVPRFAVIVEGPADAILLPTLFREAAGARSLKYRVVPGLSALVDESLATLGHHAASVGGLADGDEGGRAIVKRIEDADALPGRMFSLRSVCDGCTLEDLVRADVFAEAINSEISTWGLGDYRVKASDLSATGRWNALIAAAESAGTSLKGLAKPRVAQRVVDIARRQRSEGGPSTCLDPRRQPQLRALHESLEAALGISSRRR